MLKRRSIVFSVCLMLLLPMLPLPATGAMLGTGSLQQEVLSQSATLYYRYRDSALLAREERILSVPRNTSPEQAMVMALVAGPGTLAPHLSPLFPTGTALLNLTTEGGTVFVTFNEALYNRYPDEEQTLTGNYLAGEGRLRRRLAMAALANTLTQSGQYSQVQVLVRPENYFSASMRLSSRYYLEEPESHPAPLTRQEEYVFSPYHTTDIFMRAWQDGNIGTALQLVHGSALQTTPDALPADHELEDAMQRAPHLVQYALSPGLVSLDGQSATISVSCRLLDDRGSEQLLYAYPLRLLQREGIFVIPYESVLGLMRLQNE